MNEIEYHEQLKKLNAATYKDKKPKSIDGWDYLTCLSLNNGFYCDFYKKNGKYAIVNRGSDFTKGFDDARKDYISDKEMYDEKIPQQAKHAREAYLMIKSILKEGESIVVTGYSLGGSLAQIVGAETGVETVTFGAYGVKNLKGVNSKYENNIINYGEQQDPIYFFNFHNHIGKKYVLPISSFSDKKMFVEYTATMPTKNPLYHLVDNIGSLKRRVNFEDYYSKDDMWLYNKYKPFELKVEYNDYRDDLLDLKNRVFYKSEFPSTKENSHLIPEYVHQYYENNGKMPTREDLDKRVRTGELIYVESYTRSDGTKVSGYYRRYPRD